MRIVNRGILVVVVVLVSAVALAGCGQQPSGTGGAPTPTTSPAINDAEFNDADVTFAQQMIPHHQAAIQMAEMAQARSQNQQIKDLANRIETAQQPEIQTMTGWLQAWGKPVPTVGPGMMPNMPGGMPNMPGMPSSQDWSRMMGMSGPQFDRMFLQMMVAHHQGAVAMAQTEQAQGSNPDAKRLARDIETSQTEEISQMQQMLGAR